MAFGGLLKIFPCGKGVDKGSDRWKTGFRAVPVSVFLPGPESWPGSIPKGGNRARHIPPPLELSQTIPVETPAGGFLLEIPFPFWFFYPSRFWSFSILSSFPRNPSPCDKCQRDRGRKAATFEQGHWNDMLTIGNFLLPGRSYNFSSN